EVATVVCLLTGEPRQGRIGVGWSTLSAVRSRVGGAPDGPPVTVAELDDALDHIAATTGPGSAAARQAILADLFAFDSGRGRLRRASAHRRIASRCPRGPDGRRDRVRGSRSCRQGPPRRDVGRGPRRYRAARARGWRTVARRGSPRGFA